MSLVAAIYNTVLGMRKRTWASGMTVRKNEIVKSPADNEDYERVTATGGGTVDPADDTTNYVARSYTRVLSLPKSDTVSTVGSISVLGFAKTNFSLTTAADIWASYSGIWGTETLSFGVGVGVGGNDANAVTTPRMVISGDTSVSSVLAVNNTILGYGVGTGGTVTVPELQAEAGL